MNNLSPTAQFRVLVTGSRNWPEEKQDVISETLKAFYEMLQQTLDKAFELVLVHGTAPGVDTMAAAAWIALGGTVEPHPADWNTYGIRAGYVRNAEMVAQGTNKQPQVTFAFIHDNSRGASMCATLSERAGIPTYRVVSE